MPKFNIEFTDPIISYIYLPRDLLDVPKSITFN